MNSVPISEGVMYDPGGGRLFVDDISNQRVIIFDGGILPQGDYFNP